MSILIQAITVWLKLSFSIELTEIQAGHRDGSGKQTCHPAAKHSRFPWTP